MKNKTLNIFKVEYNWFEGDHDEAFLGKDVEAEQFETDLIKAKRFADSLKGKKVKGYNYLGKGYSVECLPEYYAQIVWYLTEKLGYVLCDIDPYTEYDVDDFPDRKIRLTRVKKRIERHKLKA